MKGGLNKKKKMAEEYDDLDQELDEEMQEVEAEPAKVEPKPQPNRARVVVPQKQKPAPIAKDRYEVKYQPEILAVVDNVKGEIVAQGFKDEGSAAISARMLNNQEKMMLSLGV